MKLLIAYDGSECSDAALENLRLAGLPPEVEAVVITVEEAWLPPAVATLLAPPEGSSPPNDTERAFAAASRACARIESTFPTWDVRPVADRGSPAGSVLKSVEELQPDLIVVGSHGMSVLERLLLGSVSQRIVSEAPCSVRVARSHLGDHEHAIKIAIGVDGSPGAIEAVRAVARRAWPDGTEALILTIFDKSLRSEKYFEAEFGRIDQLQWDAAMALREAGIASTRASAPGDPKHLIPQRAEAWGASSIFVGSRGHGLLERLRLGSVANAVAARAHCSVEVIRPREARA